MMFETHDIIVAKNRTWRITANCLGALHQESVVGLEPIDQNPSHDEAMVPSDLLQLLVESGVAKQYRDVAKIESEK